MTDKICANVGVYRSGQLQQGYSLNGDRIRVTFQSRGFSVVVEMEDNPIEDRPQALVKVCGHIIFDTEEFKLEEPEITDICSVIAFTDLAIAKEARASVALDGQTQSVPQIANVSDLSFSLLTEDEGKE